MVELALICDLEYKSEIQRIIQNLEEKILLKCFNRLQDFIEEQSTEYYPYGAIVHVLSRYASMSKETYFFSEGLRIYLPMRLQALQETLEHYVKFLSNERLKSLVFTSKYERISIFATQIHSAETKGRMVNIRLIDGRIYHLWMTLQEIENHSKYLIRISHTFVISVFSVSRYTDKQIWLVTGEIVKISNTFRKKVLKQLGDVYVRKN